MPRVSLYTDPSHIFFLLTPSRFGRTFAQAVAVTGFHPSVDLHLATPSPLTARLLGPKVNPKGVL